MLKNDDPTSSSGGDSGNSKDDEEDRDDETPPATPTPRKRKARGHEEKNYATKWNEMFGRLRAFKAKNGTFSYWLERSSVQLRHGHEIAKKKKHLSGSLTFLSLHLSPWLFA